MAVNQAIVFQSGETSWIEVLDENDTLGAGTSSKVDVILKKSGIILGIGTNWVVDANGVADDQADVVIGVQTTSNGGLPIGTFVDTVRIRRSNNDTVAHIVSYNVILLMRGRISNV